MGASIKLQSTDCLNSFRSKINSNDYSGPVTKRLNAGHMGNLRTFSWLHKRI